MAESSCQPEDTQLSGKVLKILCHLYEKVESLETFAKAVVASQPSSEDVIQPGDRDSYVSFLKSTVVCTCRNARSLPQSLLLQQHSHQDEVILRVIERIRQREGRASTNLMVIGYRLMSADPDAQISSSSRSIEYRFPNNNTGRLQYTPWKTLLSRIGDDAMEFLLETRAVFMPAATTCYVQLTGTPLYELWPFHRYYAQNQRNPATQRLCTSLLNDSKCKSRKRRRHSKGKVEPSSSCKKFDASLVQPCGSGKMLTETCIALVQENRESFSEIEHVETDVENGCNVDNNKKPHAENEGKCCSAKKRKAELRLDTEPDEKRRAISESVSVSDDRQDIVLVANSELLEPSHSQRAPSNSLQVPGPSPQRSTASFKNRKHRRKRKGKLHDGMKNEYRQKIVAFDHRLVIERTPMFFSRDLTERYPPRYVLHDSDTNNPSKLLADILSVRVLYNGNSSSVCYGDEAAVSDYCNTVKQKLLNIIQLIIKNHRLCRYRFLLNHHCSLSDYTDKNNASSRKQTLQNDSDLLTKKTVPKLQVPVYCRGHKSSSSDLASVPAAQLPQDCAAQLSSRSSAQLSVCHLLEHHCSQRAVYLFVRACSLRVLPTELFGSAANRNKFFHSIRKIIEMGRYEQLSLGCLMRSVRVTHCHWMKEIRSNTERLRLLAKVLCWLINAYVMPLIKSYFYVTDSATYRNRMFYYRKSLWKKIHRKVIFMLSSFS